MSAVGVPVSIPERRKARRVALEIPVKVRLWESAVPEQKVELKHLRTRGVLRKRFEIQPGRAVGGST